MFDDEFRDLLAAAERSPLDQARRHLQYGKLAAYLRVGPRLIDFERTLCVQIVSVDIKQECDQRKGAFTAMVARIREITSLPIFVENVLNVEFGDALLRHGYIVIRDIYGVRDFLLR